MRLLLALALVTCAAPRPFVPARVYVVAPCVREKHEEMGNGLTLRDSAITDDHSKVNVAADVCEDPYFHAQVVGGVITIPKYACCESSSQKPAVSCGGVTVLRYDGCRWACRPLFDLVEQPPAHINIDFQGYRAEGQ